MKINKEEIFPLVNLSGSVIGKSTRGECHSGTKLLHPVVHLHVIGSDGTVLLQKRSMCKDIQPGKWDTAVGGHVDYGEDYETALKREAREELGIGISHFKFVASYIFESEIEREYVNVYAIVVNPREFAPVFDVDEIDEIRFFSFDEVLSDKNRSLFTPNFISEFSKFQGCFKQML